MHFTYEEQSSANDLQQGDLIQRTDDVDKLLKEVHPHYFASANYRYFLVLTQSCDLVRRDGKSCKSRYVSIAAVRPVSLVVQREIEKLQNSNLERTLGFCSAERKPKLVQFMERLLNNNETDYFYLHQEPTVGLIENHCAFLHLSIAVKSQLHYSTLLSARILSLDESFQHKLGYLVGSMYSRVGTEDWHDAEEFKLLTVKPSNDDDAVHWIEKSIHRKVLKILDKISNPTVMDLRNAIEQAKQQEVNRKDQLLRTIEGVLTDLNVPSETVQRATTRLRNNVDFKL